MRKKLLQLGLSILCLFFIVGCGSSSNVTTSDPDSVSQLVLGTESDTALSIQVNNETGSSIKTFQIKTTDESEYSDNLIPSNVLFEQGQAAMLYYEPGEEETDETDYNVKVILQDGSSFELSTFPMRDMKESVTLHLSKSVVFIKYVSLESGESVSTLDIEVEAKEKRDAEEAAKKKDEEDEDDDNDSKSSDEDNSSSSNSSSNSSNYSSNNSSSSTIDDSSSTTPSTDDTTNSDGTDTTPTTPSTDTPSDSSSNTGGSSDSSTAAVTPSTNAGGE